ncbi:MAG: chloride channel protein, partial [Nodosilinea sp.]
MSATSASVGETVTTQIATAGTPLRELDYPQTLAAAAAIGVVGGIVATTYYVMLEGFMHVVWHTLPEQLAPYFTESFPATNYVWIAASLGGLLVGLTIYWMGLPGEVALVVEKVHDPGYIDIRQTPAMVVASLFSIVAGGSAGPEAPLVQVNGSMGGWAAQKLSLTQRTTRIFTFCGMAAALGAFFGAPLGGALFALEIPHRRGLEYYEALIPATLAAILSFVVFRLTTGLSIGGMYHFTSIPPLTLVNLAQGAVLGAIGAATAALFVLVFRIVDWLTSSLEHRTILLATLGGLSIGLIA